MQHHSRLGVGHLGSFRRLEIEGHARPAPWRRLGLGAVCADRAGEDSCSSPAAGAAAGTTGVQWARKAPLPP